MRYLTAALIILGTIGITAEAKAQSYIETRGTMANLEQLNLPNAGWELSTGYDAGWYRYETTIGEHKHLGDATSAIYTMGYLEYTMGRWTPSVGLGGGYSLSPGRPVVHLSAQVAYDVSPSWAVTAGFTYRYYYGPDGEDGFTTIGIRRKF